MHMNKVAVSLIAVALCAGGCGPSAPPHNPADTAPPPSVDEPDEQEPAAISKGKAALEAKDFATARAAFESVLARSPNDPVALHYLGVALEGLGDTAGAEKNYRAALAAKPDLADAAVNLSALLISSNRLDEAVALLRPFVARSPRDPMLHINLAVALLQSKDAEGAVKEYKAALAAGDNPVARLGLAEALVAAGHPSDAVPILQKMLADPASSVEVVATVADLLRRCEAYADCVAAYDKAISMKPAAELYAERGICRRSLKDHAGAKADYQKAVEIDPAYGPAWYLLGQHLWAIEKKKADAIKAFDQCAKVAPQSKCKAAADALRAGKNP
jgi:Flp pilus assembly protein TadD